MTVQVPFELRRRGRGGPAQALFLPTRDLAAVLAICTHLGLDPSGRVYDVAGGFVLKLERPTTEPIPGAIRLWELAADFYLPGDAELIPALLDDEANGLVRDGGLVFLPGGCILRFDRRAPVALGELVRAQPRARRSWTALPEPRRLAERVTEITWELPERPPEALYQEFEQDLRRPGSRTGPSLGASEQRPGDAGEPEGSDRPEGVGTSDPADGSPGPGGGKPAGSRTPSLPGLVHSLRGLLGQAGAGFSALKEKFQWEWVDHSALVRKLLREFREGDPSRALQHAFSMVPADPRSRRVEWGNRLPWSRAMYNLLDLLGRPARGESIAVWRAKPDLMDELTKEYRKAAMEALRQGDYRRAAYIYGKLLGDDRLAAGALQRGGLHRDAAILYLKKLNDPKAAAQAFEAAGDFDRAIELYRQLGQHVTAGDLLRRIGAEDAAVAEYLRAAELWAASSPPDHYNGGLLLLNKAQRPHLAFECFQKGWERRPEGNAVLCATELIQLHAERSAIEPIRTLLDQADAFFDSLGSDDEAGRFYKAMVVMTGRPDLGSFAEEVHDRALLSLARRLRHGIEGGRPHAKLVSGLLGEYGWPTALVSDADFAAAVVHQRTRGRDSSPGGDHGVQGVQVGRGTVTAACLASATGELFLGFDSGLVVGFRPGRNQIVAVAESPGAVISLAVDPEGQTVVALRQSERGTMMSCSVRGPDGSFRSGPDGHFPGLWQSWLTPILPWGVDWLVGLGGGHDLLILDAVSGLHWEGLTTTFIAESPPRTALLLPVGATSGSREDRFVVLTHDGPRWILLDVDGHPLGRCDPGWCPAATGSRPLRCVPLPWRHVPPFVELVGLDQNGAVYAAQFDVEDGRLELLAARVATTEGGYLAATHAGTNTVVAVSPTRIDWLSYGTDRFQSVHKLNLSLPSTVACFTSSSPREILAVCSDGFVARIAAPRRVSK